MGILATPTDEKSFQWTPQPKAAALVNRLLTDYAARHPRIADFTEQLHRQTGTRLLDWVDHLVIPTGDCLHTEASAAGYTLEPDLDAAVWRQTAGMFPPLVIANPRVHGKLTSGVAIKVEDLDFFLQTHGLTGKVTLVGEPRGPLRSALIDTANDTGFWIVERHGFTGFTPPQVTGEKVAAANRYFEQFKTRQRKFDQPADGFSHARELIQQAEREIGIDWTADRFFAAERIYWQSRNRAGQVQYARQQELGLGWANHDHHTYRASRQYFRDLIATLELLGFECRERFYAGREAGWGAQVLEQHNCGLCVFADVDLSPDEVADDFAHQPLADRNQLGTVGLWCALHGEAFLEAGMHHLEAQFDFDSAREQLKQASVGSMAPFTNLPYLRQAFTVADKWPVEPGRIDALLAAGKITREQADTFRREGALGSHLEVLQRDEGYKGFNQTGISDIISRTDPRRGA